ncbi:MAG TPA: hypothetical protein QGG30_02820 [Acidobacteriota bacterium]|nr:hypothetical protein [Acidobacteriota bacterium]
MTDSEYGSDAPSEFGAESPSPATPTPTGSKSMNLDGILGTVTDALKGLVGLGVALAAVFLVVDILQPGTTGIVGNVAGLITQFTDHGVVGIITLIVFWSILSD